MVFSISATIYYFYFFMSCSYWLCSAWRLSNHDSSFVFMALSPMVPSVHSLNACCLKSITCSFISKRLIISSFSPIFRHFFFFLINWSVFPDQYTEICLVCWMSLQKCTNKSILKWSFSITHVMNSEPIKENVWGMPATWKG